MLEEEEAGTGLVLGTAEEVEEVVEGAGVEEEGVGELGQEVGILQGLHLGRGGLVAGWGSVPSAPVSARWNKQGGSWEPLLLEVEEEEVEGEGMLLHWIGRQVEVLEEEE